MGKDADTKVEMKTVIATAVVDEDEVATDEWEEMICAVTEYRKRWQQLTDEKDAAQAQKTVLTKRVFAMPPLHVPMPRPNKNSRGQRVLSPPLRPPNSPLPLLLLPRAASSNGSMPVCSCTVVVSSPMDNS